MIIRHLYEDNWRCLPNRHFEAMLPDNDRESSTRLELFYQIDDHVMIRAPIHFRARTSAISSGPFAILTVHTNATVTIEYFGRLNKSVSVVSFRANASRYMEGV